MQSRHSHLLLSSRFHVSVWASEMRNGKDVLCTYDEVHPRTVVCFYVKISMAALGRLCLLSLSERRDGPAFAHRKTLSSRQQALFVSHQVQAAMFSQPKITARRREGGAKELQEFDKWRDRKERRDGGRERDPGQMRGDLEGGVGVKRSERKTHSEVISMFIRPRRRGGSKIVSQGCFSVVSGCCNDDRFLENLIFSHALYFSRIRPRLAKRHVQIKGAPTGSLSARQLIWISAGLTSCSENNPVNNTSSRTLLMCCAAC